MRKRYLFIISIVFSVTSLTGCQDDNENPPPIIPGEGLADNEIIISDISGIPHNVTFNKVKAEISGVDWETIHTVEAAYEKGNITLILPASFSREKLMKVVRDNTGDYTGFWIASTDNPDARVAELKDIYAYDNDKRVGRIYLTDWSHTGTTVGNLFIYYHYSDQVYSLGRYTATESEPSGKPIIRPYQFEGTFQKGWNAYAKISQTEQSTAEAVLCTTLIESKQKFAWHFESYIY